MKEFSFIDGLAFGYILSMITIGLIIKLSMYILKKTTEK